MLAGRHPWPAPRPEAVAFWILGAIAVAGAIGVVAAPKAVYSAMFLAATMIALAMIYVAQDALFLGVVQVVVYTGAVMMLFLFVLMLIGVDSVGVAGGNPSRTTDCRRPGRAGLRHPADRGNRQRGHHRDSSGLTQANRDGNVQGWPR